MIQRYERAIVTLHETGYDQKVLRYTLAEKLRKLCLGWRSVIDDKGNTITITGQDGGIAEINKISFQKSVLELVQLIGLSAQIRFEVFYETNLSDMS